MALRRLFGTDRNILKRRTDSDDGARIQKVVSAWVLNERWPPDRLTWQTANTSNAQINDKHAIGRKKTEWKHQNIELQRKWMQEMVSEVLCTDTHGTLWKLKRATNSTCQWTWYHEIEQHRPEFKNNHKPHGLLRHFDEEISYNSKWTWALRWMSIKMTKISTTLFQAQNIRHQKQKTRCKRAQKIDPKICN